MKFTRLVYVETYSVRLQHSTKTGKGSVTAKIAPIAYIGGSSLDLDETSECGPYI